MKGMGSLGWWIRSCSSKFCGHRADIQMVNTCMGIQSPGLRWPSTLVTTNTSYGARSLHHTHQMPSTWDPAPAPAAICLGPHEQRLEGRAVRVSLGSHLEGLHPGLRAGRPRVLSPHSPFVLPRPTFSQFSFCPMFMCPSEP